MTDTPQIPDHLFTTAEEQRTLARRLLPEIIHLAEQFNLLGWATSDLGEDVEGTPEGDRLFDMLSETDDAVILMRDALADVTDSNHNSLSSRRAGRAASHGR